MRPIYYVLGPDGRTPRPAQSLEEARGIIDAVQIALTERGNYRVSTIFLHIDLNFRGKGPPLLFETMAFDDTPHREDGLPDALEQIRSSTYEQALAVHAAVCQQLWGDNN